MRNLQLFSFVLVAFALAVAGCDIITGGDDGGGGGGATKTSKLDGSGVLTNPWEGTLGKTYDGSITAGSVGPFAVATSDGSDSQWFVYDIAETGDYGGEASGVDDSADLALYAWWLSAATSLTFLGECDDGDAGVDEDCTDAPVAVAAGEKIYVEVYNWGPATTDYLLKVSKQ